MYFLVTFIVTTLFACAEIADCAPVVSENTFHIPILPKQSTKNHKSEFTSASSSNELENTISPLNNELVSFGVLTPPSRRNRLSDHTQKKFPISINSSFVDLYNYLHGKQRDEVIESPETKADAGTDSDDVTYTLLSESELGDYSESYEGGSLSKSESEEDDDGEIFIDCTSSRCSDDDEISLEGMELTAPPRGDDDEIMTVEEFNHMADIFMDMADLAFW